jgi:tartrate dehydrogenase/decarboxylase/D-malate dehydrogenase
MTNFGPLQSGFDEPRSGHGKAIGNRSMSNQKKQYRIAVIPGDGIGKEVVPEGLRVLEQAAKKHGVALHFDHFDFASWDYYEKHGDMMPEDW